MYLSRKNNAGFSQRSRKNIGALKNQELPILSPAKQYLSSGVLKADKNLAYGRNTPGPASRKVEGSVNGGKARCEADGISDVRSRKEAEKEPRRPPLFELARRRRRSSFVPSGSTVSFDLAHAPSNLSRLLDGRQRFNSSQQFCEYACAKSLQV